MFVEIFSIYASEFSLLFVAGKSVCPTCGGGGKGVPIYAKIVARCDAVRPVNTCAQLPTCVVLAMPSF